MENVEPPGKFPSKPVTFPFFIFIQLSYPQIALHNFLPATKRSFFLVNAINLSNSFNALPPTPHPRFELRFQVLMFLTVQKLKEGGRRGGAVALLFCRGDFTKQIVSNDLMNCVDASSNKLIANKYFQALHKQKRDKCIIRFGAVFSSSFKLFFSGFSWLFFDLLLASLQNYKKKWKYCRTYENIE